jgi:DNA-binding MarR family transcriptional regulator
MRLDVGDGRARVVEATPFGVQQMHAHAAARCAALEGILVGWDDESLTTFTQLLERFASASRL